MKGSKTVLLHYFSSTIRISDYKIFCLRKQTSFPKCKPQAKNYRGMKCRPTVWSRTSPRQTEILSIGFKQKSVIMTIKRISFEPVARHTVPPLRGKHSIKYLLPVIAARCAALRFFCFALYQETFTQICSFCYFAALSRYSEFQFIALSGALRLP